MGGNVFREISKFKAAIFHHCFLKFDYWPSYTYIYVHEIDALNAYNANDCGITNDIMVRISRHAKQEPHGMRLTNTRSWRYTLCFKASVELP